MRAMKDIIEELGSASMIYSEMVSALTNYNMLHPSKTNQDSIEHMKKLKQVCDRAGESYNAIATVTASSNDEMSDEISKALGRTSLQTT